MITAVVATLSASLAAIITALLSKPKQKADAHMSIATGASTAVDAITDVLEQVREELEEARLEIQQLRTENAQLRESVALLNMRITDLHTEYGKEVRDDSSG